MGVYGRLLYHRAGSQQNGEVKTVGEGRVSCCSSDFVVWLVGGGGVNYI